MIKVPKFNYCETGKRIQAGDELAFAGIFHELYKPVYNRALEVLKNPCDADEASQDIFIKLWRKKSKWDPSRGTFMGWFLTLAERSIIDAYRSQQRARRYMYSIDKNIVDWIDDEDNDILTTLELVPDRKPDVLSSIIADETMRHIEEAVLSVENRKQRLAWILRHFEGYSPPEISEIIGYPVGTCKIWIHRCQKKIRAVLEETYMQETIVVHLTCVVCGDTWFCDMTEPQLTDYMSENPEETFTPKTSNDGEKYMDIGGAICDGCQDLYEDEFLETLAEEKGIERHTIGEGYES